MTFDGSVQHGVQNIFVQGYNFEPHMKKSKACQVARFIT